VDRSGSGHRNPVPIEAGNPREIRNRFLIISRPPEERTQIIHGQPHGFAVGERPKGGGGFGQPRQCLVEIAELLGCQATVIRRFSGATDIANRPANSQPCFIVRPRLDKHRPSAVHISKQQMRSPDRGGLLEPLPIRQRRGQVFRLPRALGFGRPVFGFGPFRGQLRRNRL